MATPSQVPVRYPSGVSTDNKWGPLANYGQPNPFMYHTVYDDFDQLITNDGLWTVYTTSASGGTTVNSNALTNGNGEGGQLLHTTGGTNGNVQSIELTKASFILPPATSLGMAYSSKKVFFFTRLNVTTVASTSWTVGLINQSSTPILQPTDGIYITSTNATNMSLNAYSGSSSLWSVNFDATAISNVYANASWFDVGFYMDRNMDVYGFLGYPLFGWVPQQAWTGTNNVNAQPPALGACCAYNVKVSGTWTPSTALLTPAQVIAGNAASTVYSDFIFAAKER